MLALAVCGALIAAGSMFVSGCHDKTKDLDKCLSFAKSAGATVGYVINTSAGSLSPEVNDTIAAVTKAIVTELPKSVTLETIAADLRTISTNAVRAAIPQIYEKYPQLVDETVNVLLDCLQTGLTTIGEKYPTETANAEMFYKIAYAFFDSVNTAIQLFNREVPIAYPVDSLVIVDADYGAIVESAKLDGLVILGKEDFDALMTALKK